MWPFAVKGATLVAWSVLWPFFPDAGCDSTGGITKQSTSTSDIYLAVVGDKVLRWPYACCLIVRLSAGVCMSSWMCWHRLLLVTAASIITKSHPVPGIGSPHWNACVVPNSNLSRSNHVLLRQYCNTYFLSIALRRVTPLLQSQLELETPSHHPSQCKQAAIAISATWTGSSRSRYLSKSALWWSTEISTRLSTVRTSASPLSALSGLLWINVYQRGSQANIAVPTARAGPVNCLAKTPKR